MPVPVSDNAVGVAALPPPQKSKRLSLPEPVVNRALPGRHPGTPELYQIHIRCQVDLPSKK